MSSQPRTQLVKARASLEAMKASHSFTDFEDHWKNLLHQVERAWTKASSKYNSNQAWRAIRDKYEPLRRTDPLLAYIKNARGVDEHTIDDIVQHEPGGIGINPAEGNVLHIERMELNHGVLSIQSPQRIRVDFIPGKTKLLPVSNRGGTYPVPTSHLGDSVDPANVADVAERAIAFYEKALDDAEAAFGK
jgi:hypothetical protein